MVSSFIGLAYEGISSFLQHKQNTALHKAVNAMNNRANIQRNKLMKLDDTMLMYGIYNAEMLDTLINTVDKIHNTTSSHVSSLQENIITLYSKSFIHMFFRFATLFHQFTPILEDYSG